VAVVATRRYPRRCRSNIRSGADLPASMIRHVSAQRANSIMAAAIGSAGIIAALCWCMMVTRICDGTVV
jgi:hypothetical protein